MYQISDSDSDSDRGIRYKTDSIRNKSRDNESRSRKDHSSHDRGSRRERRSPHRDKYSKKRKSHKSHRNRDRDEPKHKEKDRSKRKRDSCSSSIDNEKNVQIVIQSPKSSDKIPQKQENEVKYLGPALPPHLQKKLDCPKKVNDNEDSCSPVQIGPALPPKEVKEAISRPEKSNTQEVAPDLPSQELRDDCEMEGSSGSDSTAAMPKQNSICDTNDCKSSDEIIGPVLPSLPPHMEDKSVAQDSVDKSKIIGPALPSHLQQKVNNESLVCGPSLPPAMLDQNPSDKSPSNCIGPILPPHLREKLINDADSQPEEEEDEEVYGPVPVGASFSRSHLELEERALEMKIAQLDPKEQKEPVREEWMLELPAVSAANLGLGPRSFRAKAGPDLSDRSSWTETPQDKAKRKTTEEKPEVDLKRELEKRAIKKRDKEQEALAKKSKRTKESLVEMHTKKLKASKGDAAPTERKPFCRETDLQVNRFDDAQRKAILKKAQLLDTRFTSGESKFI